MKGYQRGGGTTQIMDPAAGHIRTRREAEVML